MKSKKINEKLIDEDQLIKDQMEKMIFKYDTYMKRITLGKEDRLRSRTINLAQIVEGENVLEIGCATGSLSMTAKRKVGPTGRVAAIDIIQGMIEFSREKASKANLEIDFQTGNINQIPYQSESFDVVMCSFMIFHMSELVRNKGISEIYRVLKPNGRLLILDLNLPQSPVKRTILKFFLGFMLKHDLTELKPQIMKSGFQSIEIKQANFKVIGLPLLSYVLARK